MNPVISSNPLLLLKQLVKDPQRRIPRADECLRDPIAPEKSAWGFFLPTPFNNALDICLSNRQIQNETRQVWTQGSNFDFHLGDVIYDSPLGYESWEKALRSIHCSISIKSASPVRPPSENQPRFSGAVAFELSEPSQSRSQLVTKKNFSLSQDDFVKFLILGNKKFERL